MAPVAEPLAILGFVLFGFGPQLGGAPGLRPVFGISGVKPEIGQQFGRFLELILVIDPDAPAIGLFEFEEALDLLHVEVVSKNTRGLLIRQMADQSHSVVGGEERRVRTANQRATGG
jgi:hypothetical protein